MKKRIILWVSIFAGLGLLVYFLAKIATYSPTNNNIALEPQIDESDHLLGKKGAKLTLVEYSDFQCPACAEIYPLIEQLQQNYSDNLSVVFRNFPLDSHLLARLGAQAAEAASKQGKFWEMHNALFNTQETWSKENDPNEFFVSLANSLGLDKDQFKKDISSEEIKNKVNKDYQSAIDMKLQSTPSFFLNNKQINNPSSYEEFKTIIDNALQSK